jgi:hypothetical protein
MSGLSRGKLPFVYQSVQSDLSSRISMQNFSCFLLGVVLIPRLCSFRLKITLFKKLVLKKQVSKISFPVSLGRAVS